MEPNENEFEFHVCVGMDKVRKSSEYFWSDGDRQVFETHLRGEWGVLGYPPEHLLLEWVDNTNPYFTGAVSSLTRYVETNALSPYWFDYLVYRSGSCIEYAQVAQLYDRVCSQVEIRDNDLMMRTRTDILLRHAVCLKSLPPNVSVFPSTKNVFQELFPTTDHFNQFEEPPGREASIFPSQPILDHNHWIVTLRKNLIYFLPMKSGSLLQELVLRYGEWDNVVQNTYWFNAESQFRGCFRNQGFILWEHSQDKDECHGNFENLPDDLPLYAIYR